MGDSEKEFLRSVELFHELRDDQLTSVSSICERRAFKSGELVVREGEMGNEMYLVFSGQAGVSKSIDVKLPGNDHLKFEKKLAVLGPGSSFGEIALLEDDTRTATVRAETELELFVLKNERMGELMDGDPMLGFSILKAMSKVLCTRLRKANNDISKLLTAFAIAIRR